MRLWGWGWPPHIIYKGKTWRQGRNRFLGGTRAKINSVNKLTKAKTGEHGSEKHLTYLYYINQSVFNFFKVKFSSLAYCKHDRPLNRMLRTREKEIAKSSEKTLAYENPQEAQAHVVNGLSRWRVHFGEICHICYYYAYPRERGKEKRPTKSSEASVSQQLISK